MELGLPNDVTRYYVVVAKNAAGQSGLSPEVSATPFAATPARIATGDLFVIVVTPTGQVWGWGTAAGLLGDGTDAGSSLPVPAAVGLPEGVSIIDIDAGSSHTVVGLADGSAWAWGWNYSGEVGDRTTDTRLSPVNILDDAGVAPLSDVVGVAAGGEHTLVAAAGGEVWSFGDNSGGQLGRLTVNPEIPGRVLDSAGIGFLTGIVSVAAGDRHSLALDGNGDVWAWGHNHAGQLGLGSDEASATPSKISTLSQVSVIAAAGDVSAAVTLAGEVYVWGRDKGGEIGGVGADLCKLDICTTCVVDDPCAKSPTPLPQLAGAEVTGVDVAPDHGLATTSDGEVWAWGSSWAGQTGLVDLPETTTPVRVEALVGRNVTAIGALYETSIAYSDDDTWWAFGSGEYYGQRGDGVVERPDGEDNYVAAPTVISPVEGADVTSLTAGGEHTLLVTAAGTALACGDDGYALANGAYESAFVAEPAGNGLTGITQVAAGYSFSLALLEDGTLRAWGADYTGELGDGPTDTGGATPVSVDLSTLPIGATITQVSAGESHVLARASDGTVWAWGYGSHGRLGDGGITNQHAPVQVCADYDDVGGACTQQLSSIDKVVAGNEHSLALSDDGVVYAWGRNNLGQLGVSGAGAQLSVASVVDLSTLPVGVTVVDVAAGAHSVALGDDGNVYTWGANGNGQAGAGHTEVLSGPTAADLSPLGGGVVARIAAGENHSLAVTDDGRLFAWGRNTFYGQVGDGGLVGDSISTPIRVRGLESATVVQVDAGDTHSIALTNEGRVYSWGDDGNAQLCHGTVGEDTSTARPMTGIGGMSL